MNLLSSNYLNLSDYPLVYEEFNGEFLPFHIDRDIRIFRNGKFAFISNISKVLFEREAWGYNPKYVETSKGLLEIESIDIALRYSSAQGKALFHCQ